MKKQEIFDKVATHLLTQGKKSVRGHSSYCMYHSPQGLRCAVGCLIADEHYTPELENKSPVDKAVKLAVRRSVGAVSQSAIYLLEDLRKVHDEYPARQWKKELARVARANNLKFAV